MTIINLIGQAGVVGLVALVHVTMEFDNERWYSFNRVRFILTLIVGECATKVAVENAMGLNKTTNNVINNHAVSLMTIPLENQSLMIQKTWRRKHMVVLGQNGQIGVHAHAAVTVD